MLNKELFLLAMIIRDSFSKKIFRKANPKNLITLKELQRNGVAVAPITFDSEFCLLVKKWIDDNEKLGTRFLADLRIHNSEKFSHHINKTFFNSLELSLLAQDYLASEVIIQQTLAGRLTFENGNLGSGQGWHRDSYSSQFKAMLYLTDVDESSGPFEYVLESHQYKNIYKEISLRKTKENRIRNVRYTEKFVNSVLNKTPLKSKRFTGKQGTVILFDSRGIHRGSPIINGKRYALTNYFIASSQNQGIGDF